MLGNGLVSIIIPVYNGQKYLRECLDSVIRQTYRHIEIIIVDDGSTDDTGHIADEYHSKDNRIKVYHRMNYGQGAERNFATKKAIGEYIAFIDGDDVVEPTYIEMLLSLTEGGMIGMTCCRARKFRGKTPHQSQCLDEWGIQMAQKKSKHSIDGAELFIAESAIEGVCYQRVFTNSPWGRLVRKDIIEKFPFPENMGYEDFAVVYRWMHEAHYIAYTSRILYYYRQTPGSTMNTSFNSKKLDRIVIAKQLRTFLQKEYPDIVPAGDFRVFFANIQTLMWVPIGKEYKELYRTLACDINETRKSVMKNSRVKKSHRFMAAVSWLGIYPLRLIGGIYRRMSI